MRGRKYTYLEKLAQDIFAERLVVTVTGEIWTDRPIDPDLAHDVRRNWRHLFRMMQQGSMWLCCSHELHKPYFRYLDGRWLCLACRQLHPEVAKEAS